MWAKWSKWVKLWSFWCRLRSLRFHVQLFCTFLGVSFRDLHFFNCFLFFNLTSKVFLPLPFFFFFFLFTTLSVLLSELHFHLFKAMRLLLPYQEKEFENWTSNEHYSACCRVLKSSQCLIDPIWEYRAGKVIVQRMPREGVKIGRCLCHQSGKKSKHLTVSKKVQKNPQWRLTSQMKFQVAVWNVWKDDSEHFRT